MKTYAKLLGLGKGDKKIQWIIPYVENRNVLDLGCAGEEEEAMFKEDWLHARLVKAANYCLGIDNNDKAINLINAQGYNASFGDVQDFSVKHSFDVVVAADIMEHLHDLMGFFLSVKKSLKDHGYLLITTPNPFFFMRFLRCIFKGDAGVNPDHVAWFCTGTIRELLKRNGFEVKELRFGSSEPIFYKFGFFRPVLFHTSIFVAARKK